MALRFKKGDKGKDVKEVQEWLCYHEFGVAIDSDFGNITEIALKKFQKYYKLEQTGVVDDFTWDILVSPLVRATEIFPAKETFGKTVVAVAEKHLKEHPIEIGGQNAGPFVRYYMNNNEGPNYPWCAGFVSSIITQAARCHKIQVPIKLSFSCDNLAMSNKIVQYPNPLIKEGAIFLLKKSANDWIHTGILRKLVVKTDNTKSYYETIEGNTNFEGSREGVEVRERIRGFNNVDFIPV